MGDEHPHATMYREAMEALNEGEFDRFPPLLADDVEWFNVGSTEPIRGRDAVLASFGEATGDTEIKGELHDVMANGNHLIALISATATRGDETFSYRTAEIHHVNEAGQITARWSFANDTQAVLDFFK